MSSDGSHRALAPSQPLVFGILGGILLAYFAVPFAVFLARTGSVPVVETLLEPGTRTAVRNSLLTAPVATAIATGFGVPLAYLLARERFRGKRLVEALVVLPLVVPPVVGGALLLSVVGRFTPVGALAARAGVPLTDSLVGVVLAQTFVAAPFVVVTARAGFEAVDERLEQAARTLGHGRTATFRRVSLPLARRSIAAGVVLTFARAVGEFGATLMVAYNPRTMPTRIWVEFIAGGIDDIVPVALVLLSVTLVVVAAVQRFAGVPARGGR